MSGGGEILNIKLVGATGLKGSSGSTAMGCLERVAVIRSGRRYNVIICSRLSSYSIIDR